MMDTSKLATRRFVQADVAVAPVPNLLNSLLLLSNVERLSGLVPWIARTAAALPSQLRERNRLVATCFVPLLVPDHDWDSFPTWLQALAKTEPVTLRRELIERLQLFPATVSRQQAPVKEAAEQSTDLQRFHQQMKQFHPGEGLDLSLLREAHALFDDPTTLHELLVAHMEQMWQEVLAEEWSRAEPRLSEAVEAARARLVPGQSAVDTIAQFTRRTMPGAWHAHVSSAHRLMVVPSPHVTTYATTLRSPTTFWLFVNTALEGRERVRYSPVRRPELVARLGALADEARLRILELLSSSDEVPAQEIIASLGITQSSASRDLNQLRNTGFVQERRQGGASKVYRLVPSQVPDTFAALERLLAGATATDEEPHASAVYPAEIQRFVNEQGQVVIWPSRQRDRLHVLLYLADQFEPGRHYTEREVNELLRPHTGNDTANLRRILYDYRFLDRTRDGSSYWRAQPVD